MNLPIEEVHEAVREILSQVTVYVDDVAIHMTSHKPDTMVELRMILAKRGLDILDELPELHSAVTNSKALRQKRDILQLRYQELEDKIAKA